MADEEPMSELQKALLQRLGTMSKVEKPQVKRTQSGANDAGRPAQPAVVTGNSLMDELMAKRKNMVSRSREPPGTAGSGQQGEGILKRGVAPPPAAPKARPVKASPSHRTNYEGGNGNTRGGKPFGGGGGSKVAEMAARMSEARAGPMGSPVRTTKPKLKTPIPGGGVAPKPDRRPEPEEQPEEPAYMNFGDISVSRVEAAEDSEEEVVEENDAMDQQRQSSAPPLPRGRPQPGKMPTSSLDDCVGPKQLPPVRERHSDEGKRLANARTPPMSQPNSVYAMATQPQDTEEAPPPAPKRTRSFRSKHNVRVNNGGNLNSEGGSGGSNSGASGDGQIVHRSPLPPRRGRSHTAAATGAGGGHVIAPMGSSSESEYSGDGRVERMRQLESRRNSNPSASNFPPTRYPPPTHKPPPEPSSAPQLPPPRQKPTPEFELTAEPGSGFQPPQLPPPRQPTPQDPTLPPQLPPPRQSPVPPASKVQGSEIPPPQRSPYLSRAKQPGPPSNVRKRIASVSSSMSQTYKLKEFLSSCSHLIPTQIVVREGTCFSNSDQHMAKNEVFNLHFLKHTKVAVISDPTTNESFSIPFNSCVKIGIIYSPSPDDEKATPYMQLKTAGEVMKLKELPQILVATTAYDGGAESKSVSEGQVLFVEGLTKGGGMAKQKQLHVMDTAGKEKFLSAKCAGSFSTDPRHTKLHPSKLLLHEFPLPQYMILYPDKELGRSLPKSMANQAMVLEAVDGETSVIATCGPISSIGASGSTVFDISVNVQTEVEHVVLSESDRASLLQATNRLFHTFKPAESQFITEKKNTPSSLSLQHLFYQKLLDTMEGISLHHPCRNNPVPEFFNLDCKREIAVDDNTSSTPELNLSSSAQEIEALKHDTLSICSGASGISGVSGLAMGESLPRSSSALNLSDVEADDEEIPEPEAIYEDINELCEKLEEEVAESAAANPKESAKKSSILDFFKKKKGRKEKMSISSVSSSVSIGQELEQEPEPSEDLELCEEDEIEEEEEEEEEEEKASVKSEESYDEMRPDNAGYIEDNYEDVGFDESLGGSALTAKEKQVVMPPTPDMNEIRTRTKSLLQKSAIKTMPDIPAVTAAGRPPDSKKDKMIEKLENRFSSATLPRNLKKANLAVTALPSLKPQVAAGKSTASPSSARPEPQGEEEMRKEIVWLRNEVESLRSQLDTLSANVEFLMGQSGGAGGGQASEEDNTRMLKRLNVDQVLRLLDNMELSQYRDVFTKEHISGSVLAEMDEDMLRDDLGITYKIHRIRLMKVISGKVSARDVSNRDNKNYVKFTK